PTPQVGNDFAQRFRIGIGERVALMRGFPRPLAPVSPSGGTQPHLIAPGFVGLPRHRLPKRQVSTIPVQSSQLASILILSTDKGGRRRSPHHPRSSTRCTPGKCWSHAFAVHAKTRQKQRASMRSKRQVRPLPLGGGAKSSRPAEWSSPS